MTRSRNNNQSTQAICDPAAVGRTTAMLRASPLKWYGSLHYHAHKIAAMLPPHDHYVEPFAGTASVLLARRKPVGESKSETIGDRDADIVNLWRVIQQPASRRRLMEQVEFTPYSRSVYRDCVATRRAGSSEDSVQQAFLFLVACRQSRVGSYTNESGWSYGKSFTNKHANLWARLPGMLQHTGRRLRGVRIECDTYDKTLVDASNTAAFLDPPYLPETRVTQNKYLHEFGRKEHQHLLQIVRRLKKTRVLLCGYRSDLYDNELRKFRRVDIKANSCVGPTMRGRKRPSRTLSLWMNYDPPK